MALGAAVRLPGGFERHQVPIVMMINCCLLIRYYDKIMYLRDDICNNLIIIISVNNLCFCACGNVKLHGF